MHWVEFGTGVNLWLQNLGDWLAAPMEAISFLGTEYAYLFMLPALFWCIDAGLGLRVGISVMTAASLNSSLKLLFQTPRPFWINPDVHAHAVETSFGMPSGHSMNAAGLWGRLAAAVRARWLQAGFLLLILLIAVSRLYLGVHYPIDVITGLLAGAVLVWLLVRFENRILKWFLPLRFSTQTALLLFAAILLIGFGMGARGLRADTPVPEMWLERIQKLEPGSDPDPLDISGLISSTGTLFGVMWGGLMLHRQGGLTRSKDWKQALLRYITGILVLMAIYFGLKLLEPEQPLLESIFRFIRYSAAGLWVSIGGPLLFRKIDLDRRSP